MDRKEVVAICMESPLYFSMPIKMRLELVRRKQVYHSNDIRKDIINWLKTGNVDNSGSSFMK